MISFTNLSPCLYSLLPLCPSHLGKHQRFRGAERQSATHNNGGRRSGLKQLVIKAVIRLNLNNACEDHRSVPGSWHVLQSHSPLSSALNIETWQMRRVEQYASKDAWVKAWDQLSEVCLWKISASPEVDAGGWEISRLRRETGA